MGLVSGHSSGAWVRRPDFWSQLGSCFNIYEGMQFPMDGLGRRQMVTIDCCTNFFCGGPFGITVMSTLSQVGEDQKHGKGCKLPQKKMGFSLAMMGRALSQSPWLLLLFISSFMMHLAVLSTLLTSKNTERKSSKPSPTGNSDHIFDWTFLLHTKFNNATS